MIIARYQIVMDGLASFCQLQRLIDAGVHWLLEEFASRTSFSCTDVDFLGSEHKLGVFGIEVNIACIRQLDSRGIYTGVNTQALVDVWRS